MHHVFLGVNYSVLPSGSALQVGAYFYLTCYWLSSIALSCHIVGQGSSLPQSHFYSCLNFMCSSELLLLEYSALWQWFRACLGLVG